MENNKAPAVILLLLWTVMLVLGLWFHWNFGDSVWYMVYVAAKIGSYLFAFTCAEEILNRP